MVDSLVDHRLPEEVRDFWIEHSRSLRPLVVPFDTADAGSDCDHDRGPAGLARGR